MGLTVPLGMRLRLRVGTEGPLVGLEGAGLIFLIGTELPFIGRGSTPEADADLDIRPLPSDVCLKFMDPVHLLEFLWFALSAALANPFSFYLSVSMAKKSL